MRAAEQTQRQPEARGRSASPRSRRLKPDQRRAMARLSTPGWVYLNNKEAETLPPCSTEHSRGEEGHAQHNSSSSAARGGSSSPRRRRSTVAQRQTMSRLSSPRWVAPRKNMDTVLCKDQGITSAASEAAATEPDRNGKGAVVKGGTSDNCSPGVAEETTGSCAPSALAESPFSRPPSAAMQQVAMARLASSRSVPTIHRQDGAGSKPTSQPRWTGRVSAAWAEPSLHSALFAGDEVPSLSICFEGAVAQPPVDQLLRTIQMRIYRTSAADPDLDLDPPVRRSGDKASPPAGAPSLAPPSPTATLSQTSLSRSASSGLHGMRPNESEIIRTEDFSVPPVPGARLSVHEVAVGSMVAAGRFSVHLTFKARRNTSTSNAELETPPVEHRPLCFLVRPAGAIAAQSTAWVLSPKGGGNLTSSHGNAPEYSPPGASRSGAGLPAACSPTAFASDEPLTVEANEIVQVLVLTRDAFFNPSCRHALRFVQARLELVEAADPDGLPPPPRPVIASPSGESGGAAEANEPSRADHATALYLGGGYHKADFVREYAGLYQASACLRNDPISGGTAANSMSVRVVHAAVHPPSCTCREIPHPAVDPRSLKGAIERERLRHSREQLHSVRGDDASIPCANFEPPICIPEGTVGCMEVTALDRFGNRCHRSEVVWHAALIAQETWAPDAEEEDIPEHMPRPQAEPLPDGEVWVETCGNGEYQVRFRGRAGRYMLSFVDGDNLHCARSPYAVLIVPPVGGPVSARPHGAGARSAIADEWAQFLLRPSEFLGCEPGPCTESRELFGRLRVSIDPVISTNGERSRSPSRRRSPSPERRSPERRSPERRMVADVILETHYGGKGGKRGARRDGNKFGSQTASLAAPQVEPGAHLVRYRIASAGAYRVKVCYGETELSSSPFDLQVYPALMSIEHCKLVGLCESTGEVVAGQEVSGAVLLADRCGNPVLPGHQVLDIGIKVVVEPIGPTLDPCGVEEQGTPERLEMKAKACALPTPIDDDHPDCQEEQAGAKFAFTLVVAGWYRVTAYVSNMQLPLPSGCFPLLVHPRQADPALSRIEDPVEPDESLAAGDRFSLLATLRDEYGNVCTTGGHELRATVRAPKEPIDVAHAVPYAGGYIPSREMVLWDRRDGSYEVMFTPMVLGRHSLAITMADGAGVSLLGGKSMDFDVVPGLPSPEHCIVKGKGARAAWAGVISEFVIEARDAAGNLVSEHDLPLRIVITPNHELQQLTINSCGDGRHCVRYQLPISGIHRIAVLVGAHGSMQPEDRCHVHGSPFEVAVHSGERRGAGIALQDDGARPRPVTARGSVDKKGTTRGRDRSASPAQSTRPVEP
jgi:hypothetical protein